MWKKASKSGGVSQALNEKIEIKDTERLTVELHEARAVSDRFLLKSGFNREEAVLTTENLIEAELAGKLTHGIIRLPDLRTLAATGDIKTGSSYLKELGSSSDYLYFDAEYQSGSVALYRSLDVAFSHLEAETAGNLLLVGIKNMSYASGYIGDFARRSAQRGYGFLSFFNSPPILIPHGSRDPQWGTDPLTFAFPSVDETKSDSCHLVHDMASSIITWGEMMNCKREGRKLPEGAALDEEGRATLSPDEGMKGGLLSIGGHKGSGMALMVEIMAGALTGSRVGSVVDGGWGGCYLLFRSDIFRKDAKAVKAETRSLLDALISSRPRMGFDTVYHPGQQSQSRRREHINSGKLELPKLLWEQIVRSAGE